MNQIVEEIPLPPEARSVSTLSRLDYTDSFEAKTSTAQELTAEEWARRVLEGAPPWFRIGAPGTWFALGLKHGLPWSRGNVLGWPVRRNEPDLILLGADSRTGAAAELFLKRGPDSLFFATLLQLDNPVMARVWSAMEAYHRGVVAKLLRRGVSSETRSWESGPTRAARS